MNTPDKEAAKVLSEARRKYATAATKARYAELDCLTGMTAAERVAELNKSRHAGER